MQGKKLLALFAAIVVLLAYLPATVLATETPDTTQAEDSVGQADTAISQPNPKYPEVVPYVMDVEQISSTALHSLLLDAEGNVYGWGSSIGDGTIAARSLTPIELPARAIQVAAGYNVSAVLLEDGSVYDWGTNSSDYWRSTADRRRPMKVAKLPAATSITAFNSVAAITTTGEVWSWGYNNESLGRVGNTLEIRQTATKTPLPKSTEVFLYERGGFSVAQNGTVYAWARNNYNTIMYDITGIVTTTTPKATSLRNISSVAYCNEFLAITTDNELRVAGTNRTGALGLGHTDAVRTPVASTHRDVVKVGNNNFASYILKSDGTVWSAGSNNHGALGLGEEDTTFVSTKFVQIEGLENVVDIVVPILGSAYAKTADGCWWAWGLNGSSLRVYPDVNLATQSFDSPVLIFVPSDYSPAEPTPETHTVTVTETWADGAEADVVTSHTVNDGGRFDATFTTPAGYTAEVTSDAAIAVDYAAGGIGIEAVSSDVGITVTYTPEHTPDPGETYTVTVIVRYDDGAFADEVTTYSVAEGAEFFEGYTVQPGYQYDSVSLYSLTYRVDPRGQTVYVSEVYQDITVELTYKRTAFNVTITTRYEDGALPDDTQTYLAEKGQPFETSYERLEGYLVDNVETNILGVTVRGDGTISIRAVNGEVFITITLYKE